MSTSTQKPIARRFSFGFLALLLAIIILVSGRRVRVAAGEETWSIYLLNVNTYELNRVNGDATVQAYALGPQAAQMFELQFAVAPDGSLAAYCIMTMLEIHEDDEVPFMTLIIHDLATGEDRFAIDLGASDGCRINPGSFSTDGSLLGVGLITATYDGSDTAWRLPIIDTQTGEIVRELNADAELVGEHAGLFWEFMYFMPEVHELSATEVVFSQLSWRTEGGYHLEAVRWNWDDNTLTPEPDRNDGIWIPETGELIWAALDETLAAADPAAPIPRRNVIRVRDADGDEGTLFYTQDQVIEAVTLINGGRELAIRLYDGYNADSPVEQQTTWIILDRAGDVRDLPLDWQGYMRLLPAPDGYVVVTGAVEGEVSVIANENGAERVLWTTADAVHIVVGQSLMRIAEDLSPFVGIE